jgi:hypothetical protein
VVKKGMKLLKDRTINFKSLKKRVFKSRKKSFGLEEATRLLSG